MLKGLALLLCSLFAHVNAQACWCKTSPSRGLTLNCSSQGLRTIPHLPAEITELLLQDNLLTTVTPGHLDGLQHLQLVNFSGNPFHCDCSIQYLTQWLQRNKAVSVMPLCTSPAELAQRSIHELTDADFMSCVSDHCFGWLYNAILCVMLCFLIGLLLWCVQLARNSTFILGIDERHTGFEAESLRSLKPKHRVRVRYSIGSLSPGTDDMDKPLFNMDILPQILDVLNKQHNIKIKVP
ncbi:glycoprotein IX (platelet) isoform X2 [Puntigrus tetrazona]|uniref:glycoprotein IX (platelet) isoform X2 n=1 Tax=Puntigrus tetrazona TaxID=1606681 RepID=UPI001C8AEDA0|nr:glycoprotein IX (platelet) isoform X2 [Puntigrus tetrazona]